MSSYQIFSGLFAYIAAWALLTFIFSGRVEWISLFVLVIGGVVVAKYFWNKRRGFALGILAGSIGMVVFNLIFSFQSILESVF